MWSARFGRLGFCGCAGGCGVTARFGELCVCEVVFSVFVGSWLHLSPGTFVDLGVAVQTVQCWAGCCPTCSKMSGSVALRASSRLGGAMSKKIMRWEGEGNRLARWYSA